MKSDNAPSSSSSFFSKVDTSAAMYRWSSSGELKAVVVVDSFAAPLEKMLSSLEVLLMLLMDCRARCSGL